MSATHFSGPLVVTAQVSQGSDSVETVAAAKTLTADDNGKIFILDAAAGATITLPALTAGFRCKFIIGAAFATTDWVIASAEGDNITGNLIVNGAAVPAAAEDFINFISTAETVGDWAEFICDSGNSQWIVTGIGNATGSITATDPA